MEKQTKPLKITEIAPRPKESKVLRVAAYARVSSEKDAAFHSLEAQQSYYEDFVGAHSDWTLVGLYSDRGISGTKPDRPEFQRMLRDCRDGKIDLVVTKSITRFARNTVVLLDTVRELKALGVDCYFEKEDMHSISPDGELLMTLLAMYAEEEARSASENQNWKIRKSFEQGIPVTGNCYGYRIVDKHFVVVDDEAKVVRRIFDMYLSGMGCAKIGKILNAEGIASPKGKGWIWTVIRKILTNEKYAGDLLLQKSYTEDFRTKRQVINHGERRQYFVKGDHEAIIPRETFDAVQEEVARRANKCSKSGTTANKKPYLFSGVVRCGNCGYIYQHVSRKNDIYWTCKRHYLMGVAACPSKPIPEYALVEKTKEVLGVDELSTDIIHERILKVVVTEHHRLTYYLKNGEIIEVCWAPHSRSRSWTDEMRQAAAARATEQRREEKERKEMNTNGKS